MLYNKNVLRKLTLQSSNTDMANFIMNCNNIPYYCSIIGNITPEAKIMRIVIYITEIAILFYFTTGENSPRPISPSSREISSLISEISLSIGVHQSHSVQKHFKKKVSLHFDNNLSNVYTIFPRFVRKSK